MTPLAKATSIFLFLSLYDCTKKSANSEVQSTVSLGTKGHIQNVLDPFVEGEVVDLGTVGLNFDTFFQSEKHPISWEDVTEYGSVDQIFISDGPERVGDQEVKKESGLYSYFFKNKGVILADNIINPGSVRFVIDHLNETTLGDLYVALALENENPHPVTLRFRAAAAGLSPQRVFDAFINRSVTSGFSPDILTLKPHERKIIVTDQPIPKDGVYTALAEAVVKDGRLRCQVALVKKGISNFRPAYDVASLQGAEPLEYANAPEVQHIRGVFSQRDRKSKPIPFAVNLGKIKYASIDDSTVSWVQGVDRTPGAHTKQLLNRGNYGVMNDINIQISNVENSPYKRAIILLVPGGGNAIVLDKSGKVTTQLFRRGREKVQSYVLHSQPLLSGTTQITFKYSIAPMQSAPLHVFMIPMEK